MNPLAILLVAVGGGSVFVVVLTLLGADKSTSSVLDRLDNGGAVAAPMSGPSIAVDWQHVASGEALRGAVSRFGGAKVDKSARGSQLAARLLMAGLKLRPAEWLAISVAAAVGGALLSMVRFGGSPIAGIVGAGLGYGAAQFVLKRKIGRRKKHFDQQLGPAVLSISNGVKAGYTFSQAIDLVSKNAPEPMGPELQRVMRETQLGVPIQEALGHMVIRNDSEDLRLMLTAVQIQQQVGGNLAGILDTIEFTIRERVRIKGEIKTLTGQARASGYILIVLPFALAGILQVIAPSYFGPMFQRVVGQALLGVAGFALLCGYGIIRKIVNITV